MMSESILKFVSTRRIFVLGKGPSRAGASLNIQDSDVVISANDAELALAHIVVHTNSDLRIETIRSHIGSHALIFSSVKDLAAENVRHVPTRITPDQTSIELVEDFMEDEILYQGHTVLLCMRVAEEIAKISTTPVQVYLLGFDFELRESSAKTHDNDYSAVNFRAQERAYKAIVSKKHLLKASIFHIGNSALSDMTVSVFNDKNLDIEERGSDASLPGVEVVAEITTNHFGDMAKLEKMIRRAKASGADSIKLQKRNPETFYSSNKLDSPYESPFGSTFRDYRLALELSAADFERVDAICREVGMGWFTSILDIDSFDFMMDFGPQRIKLPSTISEHSDLLDHVSRNFHGEVVVSTGYTDASYESKVVELFSNMEKLFLLQCVSAYPAKNSETQIGVVRHYHDLSQEPGSNVVPGYSSHDIGSFVSVLAVAAGARMIEKHVKFGDTDWAHFDDVAIDLATSSFGSFVYDIREAEIILGSDKKTIQPSEHHKYWRRDNG
jgi:N-acetylneuraminate synthase